MAPTIDFKKQRVVASIVRASVYLTGIKIRRITYNPTRKTISVRRIFPGEHSELWLQALSCNVDMVLIPVRDGTVIFQ
ncbi:MAG TPA: hypothetical protein VHH35_09900 [Pyrinomonadaceae bacterium]|nr:hypothetical protein [Pyrinomonadaceae bacterium]